MCPKIVLKTLVQELRPLLSSYIEPESDRIGYGIGDLMGGAQQPTIADFARILVRATGYSRTRSRGAIGLRMD